MWSFVLLSALLVALFIFYFYIRFQQCYKLWSSQGDIPTSPATFPFGHLDTRMAYTNFGLIATDLYKRFKSKGDYVGLFFLNKPVLFVLSPEFAKTVLVRDFQYFVNRGVYFNKEDDPLSANLFFIEHHDWRRLRIKMTPTFTSGKIKNLFFTICDVADEMVKHLQINYCQNKLSENCEFNVEITDWLERYSTDVIVSCAFGTQCDSLANPKSQFRTVGKKMLTFSRIRLLKLYGAMLFRRQARALGFRLLHNDVSKFIIDMCKKTIEERKSKQIERRDFMQLMIDLYRDDDKEVSDDCRDAEGLSLNDIAAQVFIFFFAGFETSSTAMTYALYELALNRLIQDKVRTEINDVTNRYGGTITYDSLMEMTYLDQVIYETMRMHPAVGTLHRIISKDYKLPNGGVAPKGTYVVVPAVAFHNDAELFPDPKLFDPDRFCEANKLKQHPFCYLPFGKGPRECIGLRFGMLETKLGLATLLKHFQFESCAKTQIPIKINNVSLLLLPSGGVWLKAIKV